MIYLSLYCNETSMLQLADWTSLMTITSSPFCPVIHCISSSGSSQSVCTCMLQARLPPSDNVWLALTMLNVLFCTFWWHSPSSTFHHLAAPSSSESFHSYLQFLHLLLSICGWELYYVLVGYVRIYMTGPARRFKPFHRPERSLILGNSFYREVLISTCCCHLSRQWYQFEYAYLFLEYLNQTAFVEDHILEGSTPSWTSVPVRLWSLSGNWCWRSYQKPKMVELVELYLPFSIVRILSVG